MVLIIFILLNAESGLWHMQTWEPIKVFTRYFHKSFLLQSHSCFVQFCYVICSVCCCSVLIVFLVLLFRCYAGVLLFCFSVIFWLFYQSSGIAPVFWCSWFYSMPKHNCPNWTKILPEMLHTENECIVLNT